MADTSFEHMRTVPTADDLYHIDHFLSTEELAVRDSVRAFVQERVLPIVSKHYAAETFPTELVPELASLGLLGMQIKGYGCAGWSAVSSGLACQELGAGDSGLRTFVSVQGSLAMFAIAQFGTEEQKQHWLPRMARGEAVGCFALTEPEAGSDPGSMRTSARRAGDSYILNGTKLWITNGGIADLAVVWARAEDGIRGFLVERGTPGYTTTDILQKFSLRTSITSQLSFDECRIPATQVLPAARGLASPLECLAESRYDVAWGATGVARACFDVALNYAKSRIQFHKPIASFQLVQQKLATMATELVKAQLLDLQLGRLKDEGLVHPVHMSLAKRNNVREALKTAREARALLGASGILVHNSVIRCMNDLESEFTYEGTDDIHLLLIGRDLTGVAAFS